MGTGNDNAAKRRISKRETLNKILGENPWRKSSNPYRFRFSLPANTKMRSLLWGESDDESFIIQALPGQQRPTKKLHGKPQQCSIVPRHDCPHASSE